jgi:hypothetical protein
MESSNSVKSPNSMIKKPWSDRILVHLYEWLGERGHVMRWEDDKSEPPKTDEEWRRAMIPDLHAWLTARGKVVALKTEGNTLLAYRCGPARELPPPEWHHLTCDEIRQALSGNGEFLLDLMFLHCLLHA